MPALPPKADVAERVRHVRFVPKADILRCEKNVVIRSLAVEAAGGGRIQDKSALDIERPKDRLLFAVGRNQVYSAFSVWRRAVGVCRYGPRVAPPTSARADR